MKLLIIILAIVAAGAGAFHAWYTRNLYVQAALLSEAYSLSDQVKLRVANHYTKHGIMPDNNAEAELPPPQSIFGTSVKRIAIHQSGVLWVDFEAEKGRQTIVFTPQPRPESGLLEWHCTSDSIEPEVLSKLKPACTYVQSTLTSQLVFAVANRNLSAVEGLLVSGAQTEMAFNASTPLMLAARTGDASIVKVLLEYGAQVDNLAIGPEMQTPLMVAIESNHPEVIDLLLAHGASKNNRDSRGQAVERGPERDAALQLMYTEFRQAARNCHVKRLGSLLLSEGDFVSPELIDGVPMSRHIRKPSCSKTLALHLQSKSSYQAALNARFRTVIRHCEVRLARTILDENRGIDVLSKHTGWSALELAVTSGCAELVSLLIRSQRLESRLDDDILLLAIQHAPQDALVRLVGNLIAAGANINANDSHGQSPLAAAIALEQPVIAKYLVDAGANVNGVTSNGSYPLVEASKKGYEHLALQLIAGGAHLDSQDTLGRTALLAAVASGREHLVESLLRAGVDIRIKDLNGVDAVLLAESQNYRHIKQQLIASSAL
ncbi:MAG: ankyrin repeat domain-containing protein [Granulosicoccus sp.]